MPTKTHCDDPARIRAGTRFSPDLEEPFWFDITEGMCTAAVCSTTDIEAWRNAANREFQALERQTQELEKTLISAFKSVEKAPGDFKAIILRANEVLESWRLSWEEWEPGYDEYWRETLGKAVIHSHAKASVRDIINQFRDASCTYDEVARATLEAGGYVPDPEKEAIEEEQEEKKKEGTVKTAFVVGALGLAGFFTYKTVTSK